MTVVEVAESVVVVSVTTFGSIVVGQFNCRCLVSNSACRVRGFASDYNDAGACRWYERRTGRARPGQVVGRHVIKSSQVKSCRTAEPI